jgi:RNA polymerase sigma factor (sigma-70 family)
MTSSITTADEPAGERAVASPPRSFTHASRTDEQLARSGSSGVDALFRRHHAGLKRYCLGMLRDPDDAADVVQAVWERALGTFSKPAGAVLSVRPWLYTVARNACLDHMRERGARQTVDVADIELSGGQTPEEAREQRAELELLLGDLAGLSTRQRSALVMRELAGLDGDELAGALDTTQPRALGLVSEARRNLSERRSGRALPCSTAQHELSRTRRRSGRLQAHLDSCWDCRSFEQRRRGRSLSSLAMIPLLAIRGAVERLSPVLVQPYGGAKAVVATVAVVGSIGVAGAPVRHGAGVRHGPREAAATHVSGGAERPSATDDLRRGARSQTGSERHGSASMRRGGAKARPDRPSARHETHAPSPVRRAPSSQLAPTQDPEPAPASPAPTPSPQSDRPALEVSVPAVAGAVQATVQQVKSTAATTLDRTLASVDRVTGTLDLQGRDGPVRIKLK